MFVNMYVEWYVENPYSQTAICKNFKSFQSNLETRDVQNTVVL